MKKQQRIINKAVHRATIVRRVKRRLVAARPLHPHLLFVADATYARTIYTYLNLCRLGGMGGKKKGLDSIDCECNFI